MTASKDNENDILLLQYIILNDLTSFVQFDIFEGISENKIPEFSTRNTTIIVMKLMDNLFLKRIWFTSYVKEIRERRYIFINISDDIKNDIEKYLASGELKPKELYHALNNFDY